MTFTDQIEADLFLYIVYDILPENFLLIHRRLEWIKSASLELCLW